MNDRVAVVYSKHYQISLGGAEKLHPFDIHKYAKVYLALTNGELLRPEDVFVPDAVCDADLRRVHSRAYLRSLRRPKSVARHLEMGLVAKLPSGLVDAGILKAFRCATGGTILAGRLALEHGIAINLGGGYHHAKPDAGGGFCVYADIPVAIRVLQAEGLIRRALVVDLDVHQGDGTAACFAGDPAVFTFSMHQGDIYPIPKHQSDLDVELARGTGDAEYLRILGRNLPRLIKLSRPDIVFLQAGCDTLDGDPLAGLKMTEDGIVERDAMVVGACVGRGIPVVMTLGGGYSARAWAVQFASIRRIIETYGGRQYRAPGKVTPAEKLHTR